MDDFKKLLAAEFEPYGQLSGRQLDLLAQHYALLRRWNQKFNLTRISDLREAVQLHYCESLFLGKWLPASKLRIVDVGSGAGFPGIPVAVLRPDCIVDLVESNKKKAAFLREAAPVLFNVTVISKRAEDCSNGYDWMIGRAVRSKELLSLRLADAIAILTSAKAAEGMDFLSLPWGKQRVLAFQVKHLI